MKEYILVILSGICKAVEKTKWPEEPKDYPCEWEQSKCPMRKSGFVYCTCKNYERQKREAFEGGALVDYDTVHDSIKKYYDLMPRDKFITFEVDPEKWEVVEQWQASKNSKYWFSIGIEEVEFYNRTAGYKTRLTATIKPIDDITQKANDVERVAFENLKPKENSANVQEEQTNGVRNSLNSSGLEIGTAIGEPQEPTIATDSDKCICPDDQCLLGNHPTCRYQPKEPTRKLVTEELIEYLEAETEEISHHAHKVKMWLYNEVIPKIQSLKAKEIDNIKQAYWQGIRLGENYNAEEYFTKTY